MNQIKLDFNNKLHNSSETINNLRSGKQSLEKKILK